MIIPVRGSVVHVYSKFTGLDIYVEVEDVVLTRGNSYLIKYVDSGEVDYVNCYYIKKIISSPKTIVNKRLNYYNINVSNDIIKLNNSKHRYMGPIADLAMFYLSKLNVRIVTPIDHRKLMDLFKKTNSGLICYEYYYPVINKKVFKKWISKNYHRILMSKNDWNKEIKKFNEEHFNEFIDDIYE